MNVLAIDASSDTLCLACVSNGGIESWEGPAGPESSRQLLPQALRLLEGAGIERSSLDLIAVAVGPGAFTGVRAACAAAQGLALGLSLPVLPLPSLLVLAHQAWLAAASCAEGMPSHPADDCHVAVVHDARMGEVYDAMYRRAAQRWACVQAPMVRTPERVAADWSQIPMAAPVYGTGSGWSLLQAVAAPDALWWRTAKSPRLGSKAVACGALAQELAPDRSLWLDPAQVLPAYVRDRVALTTQERLQGLSLQTD